MEVVVWQDPTLKLSRKDADDFPNANLASALIFVCPDGITAHDVAASGLDLEVIERAETLAGSTLEMEATIAEGENIVTAIEADLERLTRWIERFGHSVVVRHERPR